jgi:hypothetical protein
MKIIIKFLVLTYIALALNVSKISAEEKIKIGLLVPLSGIHKHIGESILQSVRLAINKIDDPRFEILPKDTKGDPLVTFSVAKDLNAEGVKIVIGPVFNQNLENLSELQDMIFVSLTNQNLKNPKNVISAGINSESQLNAIKKFQKIQNLKKTIFLLPVSNYDKEVMKAIKDTNIKIKKLHLYNSEPTKLTKEIEKITKYKERKLDLNRAIKKLEKSNDLNKERKIEYLKKKDTLGKVNFDSVVISDFDEGLKSITTSLLYADVSPNEIYFITLNQWFDTSLLKEKSTQPLYFPSINFNNYKKFSEEYFLKFNEYPSQLSIISYDLVGLIYYLVYKNNFMIDEKIFLKKNKFRGKIGLFDIRENKINHILNFYKIENNKFKKIF